MSCSDKTHGHQHGSGSCGGSGRMKISRLFLAGSLGLLAGWFFPVVFSSSDKKGSKDGAGDLATDRDELKADNEKNQ